VSKIEIIGLRMSLYEDGCDLVKEILTSISGSGVEILDGDIIVLTDKIVSKCFKKIVKIFDVKPSKKAVDLARRTGLDPRFVELVLRNSDDLLAVVPFKRLVERGFIDLMSLSADPYETRKILNEYPVFFITRREDMIWSDSGIDSSNLPPGYYAVPVEDHDEIARSIREEILKTLGRKVAVVICDTEIFLGGSIDFARGSYGIDPVDRCFACKDLYNKPKYGGVDMIVHEICSASSLVFKQTSEAVPLAIVRGVRYKECECGLREALPKTDVAKIIGEIIRENIRVLGIRWLINIFRRII